MPSWVPGKVYHYDVLDQLYGLLKLIRRAQHVDILAVRHGGDPNV